MVVYNMIEYLIELITFNQIDVSASNQKDLIMFIGFVVLWFIGYKLFESMVKNK